MQLISKLFLVLASMAVCSTSANAAAIFLTGHDPDFHARVGGNLAGARAFNQAAIGFVTDAAHNTFTAGGVNKFLFVQSSTTPPVGHINGKLGIQSSGYQEGFDFDHADASTLDSALNQLGTSYNAIVVASDFGGILTAAELNILNARSADIISFLNRGGGIYAMAESGQSGLTAGSTLFGFLPFVVSSATLHQHEEGFTVTPFGASLGLTDAHVNGNASHNLFFPDGGLPAGLQVVDYDSHGNIMSVAGVVATVPVPEPSTYAMLGMGLAGVLLIRRRRK